MTFPTVTADADPDPTTQIAWPSARPKRIRHVPQVDLLHAEVEQRDNGRVGDVHYSGDNGKKASAEPGKRHLSTWNLITLSISMGGAQVAWTVELGCVQLQVAFI
jgi:solute carrier family 45, member 1/2/4